MINANVKTKSDLERELDDLLYQSLALNSELEKLAILERMRDIFNQLNIDPERSEVRDRENFKQMQKDCSEQSLAISCIELTMKHDLRGNITEWGLDGKAYPAT
ncbi:MAG: hypothetical protein ACQCN3_13325 [Candidatus Bathyarchaeia archaeon]|jgi:hypothetical protein